MNIEIDTSLPASWIMRVLDTIVVWRGYPRQIRSDNGLELSSQQLEACSERYHILLDFIEPGEPGQNAYVERFNHAYRDEVLDFYLFTSLTEVRQMTEEWLEEYNAIRPHDALGGMAPYQDTSVNVHESL